MVGWMSVWSDQIALLTPVRATPGPTRPSQVVLISGATSPWFQASCPLGSLTHELPHLAGPLLSQKSGLANRANVPVRFGSPVIMCRMFISTGSAR
jgi:hypothetical protein